MSRRWLYLLFFALTVDVFFALFIRIDALRDLLDGQHDRATVVAVVGLGWQVLVLLCAAVVARSLVGARHALYSRQQALAAAAATSADWLWEADTDHRLTYNSHGVLQLLGYQPAELLGRSTRTLMPEAQWSVAQELMDAALRAGQGWDGVEMTWRRSDGTEVVLSGNAAAIKDERGEVVGFRGTRRAVTDREVAERALAGARSRVEAMLVGHALDIALQPIVDMATGALTGVEALARFRDGRSPDLWFREAGETGRGLELDRLAFGRAVALFPQLPADCYLSVNATPELVLSGVLLEDLLDVDLPLERLVIEITEHARVSSYEDLHVVLTPLRERGVRIAVDDTGAGYASLTHVLNLRPSIIKIDRSLITDIDKDAARRSLVTALVLLALDLGASVTGEGVETDSELQTLAALGVDAGQGYLLARPQTDRAHWQRWWTRNWQHATRPQRSPTDAAATSAPT